MNTAQLNSFIRSALKIAGALLTAHGLQSEANIVNSPDVVGVILLGFGLLASHFNHGDGPTVTGGGAVAALVLIAGLLGTGCTSIINNPDGKVVSITESGVGISIGESASTQTPECKLGFIRSTVIFLPTSKGTNGQLTTVGFANSFDLGENGAFDTSISENISSGNMATYDPGSTNSAPTTAPVIPK